MGVAGVVNTAHFGVQILGKDFYVASFVHYLGGGVVFGVYPGHGFYNFCCTDQGTLFTVHKLGQAPFEGFHSQLGPFFFVEFVKRRLGVFGEILNFKWVSGGEYCVGVNIY